MLMRTSSKTFRLVLIKPSHYDNDGYVIRWWRGGLPSNSLACLYGIALECLLKGLLLEREPWLQSASQASVDSSRD